MRNDFSSNYLEHWGLKKGAKKDNHKYVARIDLPNGLYRYFYDMKQWLAYMKDNKEKILEEKINKGVDKINGVYDKLLTDNKYVTDDYNYDKKVKEISKTKEWQDIVARKDKEYLKTDKDTGKQYMDIDSYMAKKKHPVLDAMDDIIMGRDVTLNKIEKESTIAGAYDIAKTYVQLAAIGTEFLLEKFKFSQGSYKDEKQAAAQYLEDNKTKVETYSKLANEASSNPEVIKAISAGEKFINEYGDKYQNIDVDSLSKSAGVSKEQVASIKKDMDTISKGLSLAASAAEKTAKQETQKQAKEVTRSEPSSTKNYKYKERIKQPDGSYIYIYDEPKAKQIKEVAEKKEPEAITDFQYVDKTKKSSKPTGRTHVKTGEYNEELSRKKNRQRLGKKS